MPRKVTDKIVSAFLAGKTAKQANTSTDGNSLFLHDNEIAKMENGQLWVTNAGWNTRTTYERLNALPGVSISVKQGKPHLNGVPWDGKWISVGKPNTMESRRVAEAKVKMILRKMIKEEIVRAVRNKRRISEASTYKPSPSRGRYLEIQPASNGNLILKITKEGKEELKDLYTANKLTSPGQLEAYLYDLFDDIQGNSDYRYSSDLGEDGFGLTSAPGIIMGNMSDSGQGYEDDSIAWYDPNYQITSFIEDLIKKGSFEFTKGEREDEIQESKRRSNKRRISEAVKGINLEQPHSNLYIKGWGNDTNGNWAIIVGFPNDRGFAIQTSGNLPKTHNITKSSGKNLSDEDLDTIGREITDYAKEYASKNVKSRLKSYGGQKNESVRRRKRRISEASLPSDPLQSYLISALWSSNDESDESGGEPFDANYDISDIAPKSIAQAKKDLADFIKQAKAAGVLQPYLQQYDMGQLGHDFWLTRNHHGAGFWDRSYEEDDLNIGDVLTDISEKFKELNLGLGDDGKIYFE